MKQNVIVRATQFKHALLVIVQTFAGEALDEDNALAELRKAGGDTFMDDDWHSNQEPDGSVIWMKLATRGDSLMLLVTVFVDRSRSNAPQYGRLNTYRFVGMSLPERGETLQLPDEDAPRFVRERKWKITSGLGGASMVVDLYLGQRLDSDEDKDERSAM